MSYYAVTQDFIISRFFCYYSNCLRGKINVVDCQIQNLKEKKYAHYLITNNSEPHRYLCIFFFVKNIVLSDHNKRNQIKFNRFE